MAQISLYSTTVLEDKVSINPDQINANIAENILINLRSNIEGKSNENGIVLKVNRLISHNLGKIDRVNGTSKVDYIAKHECFLCSPTKDLEIVCKLEKTFKGYIVGKNGPVVVVVQINNIDSQRFEIKKSNVYHISSGKELVVGDYLKVSIINVSNNLGGNKILALSKLLNMASKDDILKYEQDRSLITGASLKTDDGSDEEQFI